MKILFLDVDGVLNSERSFRAAKGRLAVCENQDDPYYRKITKCTIDPVACALIDRICSEGGVKIVISSTHRKHFNDGPEKLAQLNSYFQFLGLSTEIVGWTDSLGVPGDTQEERASFYACLKGHEIQKWLDEHPEVTHYAIIDDSSDMLPEQLQNFVRTNGMDGMSTKNYLDLQILFSISESNII